MRNDIRLGNDVLSRYGRLLLGEEPEGLEADFLIVDRRYDVATGQRSILAYSRLFEKAVPGESMPEYRLIGDKPLAVERVA